MAVVLSMLAFVLGFTGLWFASQAMKRMDKFADEFVDSQLRAVKTDLSKCAKAVSEIIQGVAGLTDKCRILGEDRDRTEKKLLRFGDELKRLRAELDAVGEIVAPLARGRHRASR